MISQIVDIWRQFHINQVKYLTIGGFAVNIYGFNRNTGDIDIYIKDSVENRNNLRKALKDAGIGDFKQIEILQFVPGWTDFSLDSGMRLDIMTEVKGLENIPFDELWKLATVVMVEEIPVFFLDYNNLIASKKAVNRPKDQLDIEELEKLNQLPQ
ncbi:DUF6036 family nucleotidyltransferase [Cognataquiflexum aquatile]|uniref:DUF6036 family nucleotidyltransferase n=1 Tax=Cognataquiflexum aquatile TaxID=2249427 RepID=UPI000DE940EF|nr:DUF6036 family nucleotidyltransferase [Cognataquiflexum aquatile]